MPGWSKHITAGMFVQAQLIAGRSDKEALNALIAERPGSTMTLARVKRLRRGLVRIGKLDAAGIEERVICVGKSRFATLRQAGATEGITKEAVRKRINSPNYPDWYYVTKNVDMLPKEPK